jgi:multidrug efflux pump
MAVSILLSAFLALTLTPALCATLLRPHQPDRSKGGRFSAWFNARFHRLASFYASGLGFVLKRTGRMMLLYTALCLALYAGLSSLPSSFLPDEDQGYFMSSIQLLPTPRCSVRLRWYNDLKMKLPRGRPLKATS